MVDAKAREVLSSVGQVGDTRLLLMAALLIADEHHDARQGWMPPTAKRRPARSSARTRQAASPKPRKARAADALEAAAKRLEDIAARPRAHA